jgi:hypothetical protein
MTNRSSGGLSGATEIVYAGAFAAAGGESELN